MLILSLYFLFGSSTVAGQVVTDAPTSTVRLDIPSKPEFNEQTFCKGFYELLDRVVIPELERDFSGQIMERMQSPENLTRLLDQLPFEPDNIGTGDCVFNACSIVLLANSLCQQMGSSSSASSSRSFDSLDILKRIAVLTFLRHSPVFFEQYFCGALGIYLKSLRMPASPNPEQDLYTTWSMHHETTAFSGYKHRLLSAMAQYVSFQTGIPVTIRYLSDVDEGAKKEETKNSLRNRKIFVSYANCKPKDDALFVLQANLIDTVKRMTGRLILMERVFGQIDNGGERGSIRVLHKLRNLSLEEGQSCEEDEYIVHNCIYRRTEGPFSAIRMEHAIPVTTDAFTEGDILCTATPPVAEAVGNVQDRVCADFPDRSSTNITPQLQNVFLPTLILQVPTTKVDARTALFLGIEENARLPIKTYVRKSERLLAWEQSDAHAMTASLSVVVSGKNLWFTGDRGLNPSRQIPITDEMFLRFVQPRSLLGR